MSEVVIVAAIGALPATLAAIAAVIAARRTNTGNAVVEEIRSRMEKFEAQMTAHVNNRRLHRG